MDKKVDYKLINILLIILIVSLIYFIKDLWLGIFGKIIEIILPFMVAFALSYAIYPYCKKLEDYGIPKWLAMGIIYFIIFGFLVIMGFTVIPLFYDQVVLFLSNISAFITDISSKFEIDLGVLQSSVSSISSNLLKNVGTYLSDGAINILNASINVITNLIIVIAVSVYLLWDMDNIRNWLKEKLGRRNKRSYRYVKKLDVEVNNYFVGLFKTMLIQFVEYTVILGLIGHPNYLVLGILASITTIIPYFGGLIVNILAVIIASVISTKLLVLTIIVCIVCPIIDGYVIGPKVYGKTNKLPALLNIFAVFAGGILGGFWGIVISLPVVIILMTTYNFFQEDINKKVVNINKKKKVNNNK